MCRNDLKIEKSRENPPPKNGLCGGDVEKMLPNPFCVDFGAIFCQNRQILTHNQLFVYKKFIKFSNFF
jgi:hypothetical protein